MSDTHDDDSGSAEAAMLTAIRRRALTASTYAEWHQVGRDIETLGQKLANATARAEKAEAERDEARELACASLDILRNVSDEPMRELFEVDDMDEMPAWFTRYGKPSDAKAADAAQGGLSATQTDDKTSQAADIELEFARPAAKLCGATVYVDGDEEICVRPPHGTDTSHAHDPFAGIDAEHDDTTEER